MTNEPNLSLPPPHAPFTRAEAEHLVKDAVDDGRLDREPALRLAYHLATPVILEVVLEGAHESKRRSKGDRVSVAKNIFIPLTNLCRDRCSYCTFAKPPDSPDAKTYTLSEVEEAVRGGMLPHTNAGILRGEEMAELRRWNASMGLMLESTSERLREKGAAHYYCPDKDPAVRIRMHEEAGEQKIPFTSGLLLGIGENTDERVDTLLVIRDLSDRYGHIQETIVQPFHAKDDTPMRGVPSLSNEEVAGWVAMARLVLGPEMNVQAPPNLAPEVLALLLRSGLNDWGGVSPVTVDFINPEAPWPALAELEQRTRAAGQTLVERLPVYPEHLLHQPEFFEPRVREACLARVDDSGYVPWEAA